ncbi:NAD-dependent epimerase/dehydratase family protein [Anaerolineae bacterium CFX7]|nr:NAD-dependent epimerase/dehydratase family protein [Anaerolineae bacterium CFX7]
MKILVTGGAGFIGSNLVDALAARETDEIIVADDFSSGKRENVAQHASNPRVRVAELDIRNKDAVRAIMRGVDAVYHLAVQCVRVSIRDPYLVHDVNATGTLHLLTAALDENIKRFVYCSSSEVYGTATRVPMDEEHPPAPTTPYGASKLAGEVYARSFFLTYGLPVTVVRPFNTYGPREHFEGPYGEVIPKFVVRALNDAPLVIFGDGTQTRDFTEVSDTVRGLCMAGECDALVGDVVNIARGQEVSVATLAQIVLDTLPESKSVIEHQAPRPGDVLRHYADITKARRVLGFEPRSALREGVKRYVDWLRRSEFDPRAMLRQEKLRNWE